jgi:hypothetical protein
MKNLRADAGHFRTEQNAVFNQAGVAVYLAPPPGDIVPLLATWTERLRSASDHPLISNLIAHYQFEKIHPFLDGNGRVGRLIITALLQQSGFNFADLLSLEKLIADTRDEYYYFLKERKILLTSPSTFFASYHPPLLSSMIFLPPTLKLRLVYFHVEELLATITDHSPSFDFLHRRLPPFACAGRPPSATKVGLIETRQHPRCSLFLNFIPSETSVTSLKWISHGV